MPQLPEPLRHFVDGNLMPMLHQFLPYGSLGPRVEVRQTPDDIVVVAELPGLERPEDLELHVQETMLTLSGEVEREEKREEGFDLFHTERLYGKYSRSVPLPVLVDPEQVQASYKNGVLTVRMRKSGDVQGRRVPVDFQ